MQITRQEAVPPPGTTGFRFPGSTLSLGGTPERCSGPRQPRPLSGDVCRQSELKGHTELAISPRAKVIAKCYRPRSSNLNQAFSSRDPDHRFLSKTSRAGRKNDERAIGEERTQRTRSYPLTSSTLDATAPDREACNPQQSVASLTVPSSESPPLFSHTSSAVELASLPASLPHTWDPPIRRRRRRAVAGTHS